MPFSPEVVLPTIHHFIDTLQPHDDHPYGFRASINQTNVDPAGRSGAGWESAFIFGINVGSILLMAENYHSGMAWRLMRGCPWVVNGLKRAGFAGGWLDTQS